MKKKILLVVLCFVAIFMVAGCGNKTEKNIEGKLSDIVDKLYKGIKEEDLPMMLQTMDLDEESIENFIGTNDIKFKEAVVSESMVGSIPHSVVLIRMKDNATEKDIKDAKEKIKKSADPRKWICVEADKVYVENKGNLVILIMSDQKADTIKTNFEKLK